MKGVTSPTFCCTLFGTSGTTEKQRCLKDFFYCIKGLYLSKKQEFERIFLYGYEPDGVYHFQRNVWLGTGIISVGGQESRERIRFLWPIKMGMWSGFWWNCRIFRKGQNFIFQSRNRWLRIRSRRIFMKLFRYKIMTKWL